MGSVNARASFAKLLTLGKPSYAIWFMGMNDGTDVDDTTPNADWVTERDKFITLCENSYGGEIIKELKERWNYRNG